MAIFLSFGPDGTDAVERLSIENNCRCQVVVLVHKFGKV